jgi:hypothetical protein
LPFGANRPTGCHAAALAFQLAFFFHLREHGPNPLSANTGACALHIAQAKFAWTLTDRITNQLCFSSFGFGDLTDALLELLVGVLDLLHHPFRIGRAFLLRHERFNPIPSVRAACQLSAGRFLSTTP